MDISSLAGQYMGEAQTYNADALEQETQLKLAQFIKEYLTDPTKSRDLIPSGTGINDATVETRLASTTP